LITVILQLGRKITVAKSAMAGFLVALLLASSALAASPALHALVHHDAGSTDHNCFITLFARGHIATAATVQSLLVIVAFFGGLARLWNLEAPASLAYHFSPSRAPPVSPRF